MIRHIFLILASIFIATSCVTEDSYNNDPYGNFEALWNQLDQHYCFFEEKKKEYGLDWNEVHTRYRQMLKANMSEKQLFEVLTHVIRELRDGHVNLYSSFNTARYWDWFEQYPDNFNDSIQRLYLGTDYGMTSGLKYKILPDNIGYVYCESFEYAFGNGNLGAVFSSLAICKGIIIDVRNNQGGMLTSAQKLAECFTNEEITGGYISHKTGPGHSDFSSPEPFRLKPAENMRWQKKVVVLTNRQTFSAANTFVMFMKACPHTTIMGDKTGGGGGMPLSSELPNGWGLRFSACPMYDIDMNGIEEGIEPDIKVSMQLADTQRHLDTFIELARKYLGK